MSESLSLSLSEPRNVRCGKCRCFKRDSQFFKEGRRLKTCDDCRRRNNKYTMKMKMKGKIKNEKLKTDDSNKCLPKAII